MKYVCLFFILLTTFPYAFADVSLSDVELGMDESIITTDSDIIVEYMKLDGENGLTEQSTGTINERIWNFTRSSSSTPFALTLDTLTDELVEFTDTSSVTDADLDLTGSNLDIVNIDGIDFSYVQDDTHYDIDYGLASLLVFSFNYFSGGGSNEGGSSSSSTPSEEVVDDIISEILNIDLRQINIKSQLGEVWNNQQFSVSWDNGDDIIVKSVVIGDSPFVIMFEGLPKRMFGSGTSQSSGELLYSIKIPDKECSTQTQNNCAEFIIYEIPVIITVEQDGETYEKQSVLRIDLSGATDFVLFIVMGAIALPIIGIIVSRNKKPFGDTKKKRISSGSKKAKPKGSTRVSLKGK